MVLARSASGSEVCYFFLIQEKAPLGFSDLSLHFFLSLFIRFERESIQVGEGQREREGERIPSRLCTVSAKPDVGLEPTDCEIVT